MAGTRIDYYVVLGVSRQASTAEVTRAYRRELRRLHPDTSEHSDPGEHEVETSETRAGVGAALELLREAFTVLGDPDRRAAYDQRTRPVPPPPAASPRSPRAWRGPAGPAGSPDPPLRAGPVRYRPSPPPGGER